MSRTSIITASVVALAALCGPAAAQGWSFSYGIGDPYADPYYRAYPPPPVYYGPPPIVVVPGPAPARRSVVVVSPGEVEDDLRANGFTRLSPIEASGEIYQLTATDPGGNFVEIIVSMYTGDIQDVRMLQARSAPLPEPAAPAPVRRAEPRRPAPAIAAVPQARPAAPSAPAAAAPAPQAPAAASPPASGEPDPLVVY